MINIYILMLVILAVIMLFCAFSAGRHESDIALPIKRVLLIGAMTVTFNILYESSHNELAAMIGFGLFSASIDWLLYGFGVFVEKYTAYTKLAPVRNIIVVCCILDTVSFLLDFGFGHIYSIQEKKVFGRYIMLGATDFTPFYYVHLAICYVLVLCIITMLLYKMLNTSRHYRIKYGGILIIFGILVIADAVCVMLHLPLNVSIIFYGGIVVAIYYYALYYVPGELIRQIQTMLIEKLGSGIIFFNENGECIFSNSVMWRQLGGNMSVDAQLIKEAERRYKDYYDKNRMFDADSKSWTEQYNVDGENRNFEIICQKIYDKKHIFVGSCFCMLDRTEEVKLYQRKIDFEKESNKAKTAFLSKVSHEIRTPVNAIFGMNEMILRESGDSDILHYASQIKSATDTLMGIINDILDFSKIEAGKMSIVKRQYGIEKILRNVINMARVQAEDKNLEFNVVIDPQLPSLMYGDDIRIEQVLMNLLSNAVKYTNEGRVTLKIDWEGYGDNGILGLYVEDTGIGIKEEDIPRLFKKFERIEETRNHSIQGTGLGLNITTYLLEMMDSGLMVESVYGMGSTFYCHIPQIVVDAAPVGNILEDKHSEEKDAYEPMVVAPDKTVLVVDDNRLNRAVFRNLLKQTKIKVVEAESGDECLKLVVEQRFDLIFMDYMMPDLNGVETFEKMNEIEHMCKDIPVIMLTANAVEGAMEEYLEAGFTDFLSKPVLPDALEAIIKKYL